jgi:hypothetical protein
MDYPALDTKRNAVVKGGFPTLLSILVKTTDTHARKGDFLKNDRGMVLDCTFGNDRGEPGVHVRGDAARGL